MKSSLKQKARELLGSAKLRRTGPRTAVLETLLKSERPISTEQIAEKIGASAPNKVTIYRVLESLLDAGLVHKVFLGDRSWHFELGHNCSKNQCHPHFTCTDCGQTHCFTEVTFPMAKSPHKGFLIDRQRVQLEGLCSKCNPQM